MFNSINTVRYLKHGNQVVTVTNDCFSSLVSNFPQDSQRRILYTQTCRLVKVTTLESSHVPMHSKHAHANLPSRSLHGVGSETGNRPFRKLILQITYLS